MQVRGRIYSILKTDIELYLKGKEQFHVIGETGICSTNIYEQAIQVVGGTRELTRWFMSLEKGFITTKNDIKIRISNCSINFGLFMLENVPSFKKGLRRINLSQYRNWRSKENSEPSIQYLLTTIGTLCITTPNMFKENGNQLKMFQQLQNDILFELSRESGMSIVPRSSWLRDWKDVIQFSDFEYSGKKYNPELTAYYQLALSSDHYFLQFLAYYQILEYFYIPSADHKLEKELFEEFSQGFSTKSYNNIRKIIHRVRSYDRKINEVKMLQSVLERFFSSSEIIAIIVKFDEINGPHFSKNYLPNGLVDRLQLQSNQVFPSLAKRIYSVRNALVHNKEGEFPRFEPFSEHDTFLARDIPLMNFLAERLIIKSADI